MKKVPSHIPEVVTGEEIFVEQPESALRLGRVLIVDDSPVMQKIVDRLLRSLGVSQIDVAPDAATAFRLMHDHAYDLAMLDVEMGRIDGLRLLQAMRAYATTANVPVVMMTTSRNVGYVSAARERADAYLLKPFNAATLRAKIKEALAQRARSGSMSSP